MAVHDADHFQRPVSPVGLPIVTWRQGHLSPEFSTEMACIAKSPAVRNRGDRQIRIDEIVSGGG
jgi:hypothetical protein